MSTLTLQLQFCFSFLQTLDPLHFYVAGINKYYNDTIDWIYELFEDTCLEENNDDVVVSEEKTAKEKELHAIDNDCDDQQIELYSLVKSQGLKQNGTLNNNYELERQRKDELSIKITKSMEQYRNECVKMNMTEYLEANGNDLYKLLSKKKQIDYKKIDEWKDALYVSKFFDSTKWWKEHEAKYPELALAATIMLGKPTHNAFQERVFSRGTYSDTKLRKRLKEEYFEMSVMNAINGTMIDEMYEMMQPLMEKKVCLDLENDNKKGKQEITAYLEKRKVEIDLTDIDNIKSLNIVENEIGSMTSQCTDDLSSNDGDDDDGSIDDVVDFIMNDKNKKNAGKTDGK